MTIQTRPTAGTTFGATLGTLGGSTSFSLVDPRTAFGGCMQVATTTARNAIEVPFLQNGMIVWVEADDTYYKLRSTWPGGVLSTDPDWEVFVGPGGAISGGGTVPCIPYWGSSTTLLSNIFFTRPFDTNLVYNAQGFSTNFNVNVERWVSPTGNDSNSGTTALDAWLTLEHAFEQCPKLGSGRYVIYLANGTYANTAFSIPDFGCAFDFGDGFVTAITIIGNAGSPSSVVLQNTTATMCYHNAKNVILLFQGVTFEGDRTNPNSIALQQNAGTTMFEDCNFDDYFNPFRQNKNASNIELYGTINFTDCIIGAINTYGNIHFDANINFTTPNPLPTSTAYLFLNSYGDVSFGSNLTINFTSEPLSQIGKIFDSTFGSVYLGSDNAFNVEDGEEIFSTTTGTQVSAGPNNSYYVYAGTSVFSLGTASQFQDGSSGTWTSSSLGGLVVNMSTSAKLSSPNGTQTGTPPGPFIIRNDLVEYVNYLPNPNYYANADDNRYVTTTTFTMLGNLPQNGTTMLIGPAGVSSAEQYIYVPERTEQLLGIRVYTGVGNGGGNTDTYFAYVNGAASGLSVALTNTQTNSATASSIITLSAGDRVSVRCTSAAATTAENITVTILTRKRL